MPERQPRHADLSVGKRIDHPIADPIVAAARDDTDRAAKTRQRDREDGAQTSRSTPQRRGSHRTQTKARRDLRHHHAGRHEIEFSHYPPHRPAAKAYGAITHVRYHRGIGRGWRQTPGDSPHLPSGYDTVALACGRHRMFGGGSRRSGTGLVSAREVLAVGRCGGYAIPAFHICNLETLQAVFTAAEQERAPVIVQLSPRDRVRRPPFAGGAGGSAGRIDRREDRPPPRPPPRSRRMRRCTLRRVLPSRATLARPDPLLVAKISPRLTVRPTDSIVHRLPSPQVQQ